MSLPVFSNDVFGVFGYGSLVNRQTLSGKIIKAFPARLKGWRRHWQGRDAGDIRDVALLSVHRHGDAIIDGLIIVFGMDDLPELDIREMSYDRIGLVPDDFEMLEDATDKLPQKLFIYEGRKVQKNLASEKLIQSYLDTVMLGFFNEFGKAGVERFMASTSGFERPMIIDRDQPIYPRTQRPSPQLCAWFDQLLEESGVIFERKMQV